MASKQMASKNFKNLAQKNIRLSEDENEIYGIITKKLGGGHILVLCVNGVEYMCHIGGKFRNERINVYNFVLIGLREWQSSSNKKNMTDLLENYNENEKAKLLKINGYNWNVLSNADNSFGGNHINADENFVFADDTEIDYKEIIKNQIENKTEQIKVVEENDDWLNDI